MRSRQNRLQSKRRKRRIWIISTILFFFISAIAFAIYEFRSGYLLANDGEEELGGESSNKENFQGVSEDSGKLNVLLLGVDSRGEKKSRTDTIMVAQYDMEARTVKLISIMRDTYVEIPGYKNQKINAAYFYGGTELLRQTIQKNFGIDLEYYSIVDFKGFTKIVDTLAPDGIQVNVKKRMRYRDGAGTINIDLHPGEQYLDGKQVLDYARFRNDREGDFGRVERQQEVITKLKDELLSLKGIMKIPRLLGTLTPFLETNMSQMKLVDLGTEFFIHPVEDIETLRIPVDDSYKNKNYSHAGAVLEIDFEKNREAINHFLK
ncbi:LCP family protein [Bacillus salitolerans]|uniref:Regulatory protein MsrR n=1 Tax=Bacillus salitolerans TaxID=1437434 RepID=A0ABW4LTI0_9BACI